MQPPSEMVHWLFGMGVLLLGLLEMPMSAYWRLVQDPCTLNEIEVRHDQTRVTLFLLHFFFAFWPMLTYSFAVVAEVTAPLT